LSFRVEEKLLVHKNRLGDFLRWLESEGGDRLHPPRLVSSTYFDNIQQAMFVDSEEGTLPRKKIRIRSYKTADHSEQDSNLEVKVSSVEGRYKTSKELDVSESEKFLQQGYFDSQYGICTPVVRVDYEREYFIIAGMRITIDSCIKYCRVIGGNRLLLPVTDDSIIVEIKTSASASIDKIQNKIPFQRLRFSKYCRAVNSTSLGNAFWLI
jgi:hypothetical protein